MSTDWWTLTPAAVATALQSDAKHGLTTTEAALRLTRDGPNALKLAHGVRWPRLLMAQFRDVLILLLLSTAVASVMIGETSDAWMIGLIVLLNAAVGFLQELRAARAMLALRRLMPSDVTVVQDGRKHLIQSRDLVAGDVMRVESGARLAADARLIVLMTLKSTNRHSLANLKSR
jgi:P-type Ca2+ transporter type 2C